MTGHTRPSSAADPYLDTSTTSKARNATLRRLRADVDATRNRVGTGVLDSMAYDDAVEQWGSDPMKWPAWVCGRCGQHMDCWTIRCGRCHRFRGGVLA